ncbi:MAG: hypothetical protein ACTSWW_00020 [Promethearchaeota archaeon]
MVENYRATQSAVEFRSKEPWWVLVFFIGVLPIFPLMIIEYDPSFLGTNGFILMVVILSIIGFIILVLCIKLRKVSKRVSVDASTRSLMIEILWSGLRVSKRVFALEAINRFEVQLRMVRSGRHSRKQIKAVALILQSGKRKYLTGPKDQENVQAITDQLNNLLQNHAGFPQERFADPPRPQLPETSPQSMRNQNIIAYSGMAFFVAMMIVVAIVLNNIE